MVWDGGVVLIIIFLTYLGWQIGIINSWRGLFGIAIAIYVTQMYYVDAATYLVQETRMVPEQAIAIAYLLIWFAVDTVSEMMLKVLIPLGTKERPLFFDRLFGAIFGLARALLIILLPCLAITGDITVPTAPADTSLLIMPVESGIETAVLIPIFKDIARYSPRAVRDLVVSYRYPSFRANFNGDENR